MVVRLISAATRKKITGKTPRQFKVSASADKLLDNEYIRGFPVPQIGGK